MPEVVLLAPLDKNPSTDPMVHFISGDPTQDVDLERASIRSARTALILADNSYPDIDAEDMDSRTLLTTLAVESLNPNCYTCVEVIRSDSAQHFSRTKANELVVSGRMTGALLAHSSVTHGLSKIIGDLITYPENNEFYWVDVPAELDGKTFADGLVVVEAQSRVHADRDPAGRHAHHEPPLDPRPNEGSATVSDRRAAAVDLIYMRRSSL